MWWSEAQAAEKFYHSTCYMSEAGYDISSSSGATRVEGMQAAAALSVSTKQGRNAASSSSSLRGSRHLLQTPPPPPPNDDDGGSSAVSTPCYNLMTGVLGSAKAYLYTEDESFCCVATGSPEDLTPPPSNFMDDMTLTGWVAYLCIFVVDRPCVQRRLFLFYPETPRIMRYLLYVCDTSNL